MSTRSRTTTSKRRREDVRPAWGLGRGLIVLGLIAAVVYVAVNAGSGLPLVPKYEINVDLADAGSLRSGSGVDIAGVRVGRVIGKDRAPDGTARVKVRLGSGVDPLPVDTTATVRAQGLLGARFLELRPGDADETLKSGGVLRGGSISNGVPEALATFNRKTRVALGETVRAAGAGLADRGDELNAALDVAPDVAGEGTAIAEAILARPGAAARLMPSLRDGTAAIESAKEDMANGFQPGADSLQPFIDRRAQTRATLDEAPPTLEAAGAGLTEGRQLLASVRALAGATNDVLPAAPPGLRAATALLSDGGRQLDRATPLLRDLVPTVPAILRVTDRLRPVLAPLNAGLADLRPIVTEVGKRRCDLDNFAENWRSMLGYGVAGGGRIGPLNSIRVELIASNESLAGMGEVPQEVLLNNGPVVRNPYPGYCQYSPGGPYALDRLTGSMR